MNYLLVRLSSSRKIDLEPCNVPRGRRHICTPPLHDKNMHAREVDPAPPRPPAPSYTMWKTWFIVVSLLANITSTLARPYARATIDATTLAKVRANAISSSQVR